MESVDPKQHILTTNPIPIPIHHNHRGQDDVEVACVNSPDSVVLASSEARLNEVKLLFPEGTTTGFVQGNIAFHSSRMLPILETMRARLSFLDQRGPTGWSLPFVSTVTGKVETQVDAEYWCVCLAFEWVFGGEGHVRDCD
jgi:acyl transferase domain-containing protein